MPGYLIDYIAKITIEVEADSCEQAANFTNRHLIHPDRDFTLCTTNDSKVPFTLRILHRIVNP